MLRGGARPLENNMYPNRAWRVVPQKHSAVEHPESAESMDGLMRCLVFALAAAAAAPITIEVVDVSALRNTSASEAALEAATRLSALLDGAFCFVRVTAQTETLETLPRGGQRRSLCGRWQVCV